MHPDLGPALDGTRALLFDFDGPVCSVFSALPDQVAADRVRAVLTGAGVELSVEVVRTKDPLAVLRFAATAGDEGLVRRADEALTLAEIEAVQLATPTPGAAEAVIAAARAGLPVAIVSNNSEAAILLHLIEADLDQYVTTIAGRPAGRPDLLKPDPYSLLRALAELHVLPFDAVMVGDTATDVEAARSAGVACIGLARNLERHARLRAAGADLVLGEDGLSQIAEVLTSRPR
ncbi:HAD family hydrolase [Hamadaea tsunoensis]|uniref:HAD family hydrolase n=1 Tax=Hamadaea tsunoensis TaxID=53368 RepID=UPI0004110953|nr:HAD-IA family hydrolase [Hamadaea tsunoensis]